MLKSWAWLIMKSPKTIWSSRVVSVWYQIWSFMNSQIILEPFVRPTVLAFMELTVFNFKLDWSISMIYNLVGEMKMKRFFLFSLKLNFTNISSTSTRTKYVDWWPIKSILALIWQPHQSNTYHPSKLYRKQVYHLFLDFL